MSEKTKKIISNIIILICTILVCVIIVEFFYRIFSEKKNYVYSKGLFVADKELGYRLNSLTKGFARKTEYNNEIITNSLGFRDIERSIEKVTGTTRVLVIGDSFTMGYAVSAEDVYTRQLEKFLNTKVAGKYEIINAGVAGYDTPQEISYLSRDGLKLNPDLIVLSWYYNDLMGEEIGDGPYVIDGYLVTPQKKPNLLKTKFFNTFRSWKFAMQIIEGKLTAIGKRTEAVNPANFDIDFVRKTRINNDTETIIKKGLENIDSFIDIALSRQKKVVVMLIPADFHIVQEKRDNLLKQYSTNISDVDFNKPYKEIAEYLSKKNIIVLNLYNEFEKYKTPDELYYKHDGHFTAKGNQFTAILLADIIKTIDIALRNRT